MNLCSAFPLFSPHASLDGSFHPSFNFSSLLPFRAGVFSDLPHPSYQLGHRSFTVILRPSFFLLLGGPRVSGLLQVLRYVCVMVPVMALGFFFGCCSFSVPELTSRASLGHSFFFDPTPECSKVRAKTSTLLP